MLLGFDHIQNISSAVKYHAEKNPQKVFLIDNEVKYSFQQIDELLHRACSVYELAGLKPGDVISAVIKNGVEYIVLYLASLRYGCIFNPYPFTLEAKDILKYISNVRPKILFCQKEHYSGLNENGLCPVYLVDDYFLTNLATTVKTYPDFVPTDKSPACIYYSSGTTGNPKGVVFSHQNMIANISSIVRGFKFNQDSIHLILLPLGHTASVNYSFLPCTLCGGTLILTESFWKIRAKFWDYIKKYQVNYVEVVPSILVALLNTPYNEEDYQDVNTLKYVGCGSSTLPKESQIKFMEKYKLKVANLYGLSETGPTHVDDPLEEGWEPGSAGKPLDVNEICIMDDDRNILQPGEVGEIVVKGDNVFIGYYKNPAQYEAVVQDGFFHTGDLGYMTEDKTLFFTGRKKDLIIKGGVNISPDEIDEVLHKMEETKEALTIGVPDEYLGEKIVSFIVLKDDQQTTAEKVLDFCRNHLSRDKIPNSIEFVESLPKGPSGKLLRKEMRGNFGGIK